MIHRHLVAVGMILGAVSPLSAQSVRSGIDAWQKADYAAAVAIWRPLAEGGDPDAQFNLGQAYRLGRGVALNLAAANSWFERAASHGHVDAQTTLGLLMFQGGDEEAGLKWLAKASEAGDARAMLVYGTALVNGDTVTQDPVLGYAFVSRAAAQGLAPAKETLAQLDQLLSLADRKKGLALAKAKAKAAPAGGAKPVKVAAKPAEPKPAPTKPAEPKPAEPKPVKTAPATAPAPAATGSGYRVQLGAFSSKGAAQALYAKLQGKLGGASAYYVAVGAMTRLQAGPFGKAEATATCARIKPQPCFPVAAK